jgi:hypothetical protein
MKQDTAYVWERPHTPHGGVWLKRRRALTRGAQYEEESSAEGVSTAERFSSRAVMPRIVCTTAPDTTQAHYGRTIPSCAVCW